MNQTVLFVDDDANLQAGLQRNLRHEPYRVLTANDGGQALAIIAAEAVDVVVSDEHMPNMGGLELLTTIHTEHPGIVSIMLSGQASIGTVVRALNQGQIFRYLIKPCGVDELRANVAQALAHKLLMDRCRRLLPVVRRQTGLLNAIEGRNPGSIAAVEVETMTAIRRMDEEYLATVADLSMRMDESLSQSALTAMLPRPGNAPLPVPRHR